MFLSDIVFCHQYPKAIDQIEIKYFFSSEAYVKLPPMKRSFYFVLISPLLLILLAFFCTAAFGRSHMAQKTGIGIVLGEPTGATIKYWKNKDRAVDAGLAFSFDEYMVFYSDYLFHFDPIKQFPEFSPYAGIGGVILFSTYSGGDGREYNRRRDHHHDNHDTELGVRIPVGVEWLPAAYPIGLFGEIVPGMGIIPDAFGLIQAGVGGRYYF